MKSYSVTAILNKNPAVLNIIVSYFFLIRLKLMFKQLETVTL